MASTKIDLPRDSAEGWGVLKTLSPPAWIGIATVLLVILAIAAIGRYSAPLLGLTVVSVALLAVVARQLAAEAAREREQREAARQQAQEFERVLEARSRDLSELCSHLQASAEREKSELARNLHDELGGLLTAAKMDLSWLQSRLVDPTYAPRLAQLGSVLDEAMNLKRRVVEELRPSLLDHFGLPTALRAHVESVCAKAGLQCEVSMAEDAETIPRDASIALFRVIQEGLTNILKHSDAKLVRLALTSDAQRHLLLLSDDGCGMSLSDSRFRWSHGLAGMRHRMQALGGRFDIESSPAQGTTLRMELPKRSVSGA